MRPQPRQSPRLILWLRRAFLVGTTIAVAIILLSLVLMLTRAGGEAVSFRTYSPVAEALRRPASILSASFHADPIALAQAGVLVLCLTPILRVAVAALAFALDRDRLYTLISLASLAGLALGLLGIVR